jgi:acetoacetate decarboxylase
METALVVETGLQGTLTKDQLPYAMGNLFPRPEADDHAWWWRNIDLILMTYLTPAAAAAALLPSEFSLPRLHAKGLAALGLTFERFRAHGDLAAVSLMFAKYRDGGTLAPYNEVLVGIPCLYDGQPYSYCSHIYVDTDEAAAAGRELLGFPKKLATFDLNSSGSQFTGAMERDGKRVVSINFKQQEKLFSVPLPPNQKVALSAPFDQMVMLPEPAGRPQGLPFSMLSTRFIANGIAPQHMVSLWKWENGTVFAGKGGLEYAPSEADPLAELPVIHMFASVLFKGDMACYADAAKVLMEMV